MCARPHRGTPSQLPSHGFNLSSESRDWRALVSIQYSQAQFVAGFFGDLLYSGSKSRGRRERNQGTAPAADYFPRNLSRVAGNVARPPSLRALPALRLPETRRAVWLDMAESTSSILIRKAGNARREGGRATFPATRERFLGK